MPDSFKTPASDLHSDEDFILLLYRIKIIWTYIKKKK